MFMRLLHSTSVEKLTEDARIAAPLDALAYMLYGGFVLALFAVAIAYAATDDFVKASLHRLRGGWPSFPRARAWPGTTKPGSRGEQLQRQQQRAGCTKASPWQLSQAGIGDAHAFKADYLGRKAPLSRYDICACKDGSIVIKQQGQCGKGGPGIPTGSTWK